MDARLDFYHLLVKLFYCIAAADKKVRKEEIAELKKMLKSKWNQFDNSNFDFKEDTAYQIEVVIDWLLENGYSSEQLLIDLKNFMEKHESLFTLKVRKLILETAQSVSESFSGNNKSELVFLSRLYSILSK